MEVQKAEIMDYDHLGRGVARVKGKVVFIPYTKKGMIVSFTLTKEKKHYSEGSCCEKISGADICSHYYECGGCQLQHLTKEEERIFKQEKVKNIFEKYTSFVLPAELPIISGRRCSYRNKVMLHIEKDVVGFYKEKTKQLFSLTECRLLKQDMMPLIKKLQQFSKKHPTLQQAMIRFFEKEIMLSLVGKEDENVVKTFFAPLVTSLYYNNKVLYGPKKIVTSILGRKFKVSPEAFFQVNEEGLIFIYTEVIELIKKYQARSVLDLYCGTGTISLLISPYVESVIGIEINKEAVKDAKENATLQNCKKVSFYQGDVKELLPSIETTIDTVIVDPPRSGLDLDTKKILKEQKYEYIIYISCDVMTLARDLEELKENYTLQEIKIIDEFPQTYHVECVCVLNRHDSLINNADKTK